LQSSSCMRRWRWRLCHSQTPEHTKNPQQQHSE
jgi:hypothetical protein